VRAETDELAPRVSDAVPSRSSPSRIALFTGILFGVAIASALASTSLPGPTSTSLPGSAALFALLVAAERLMMRFRYRGHIDGITLFEAALAPAILTLPTPALVLVVGMAQAAAAIIGRDAFVKASFNVAQWSAAAALGSMVFNVLPTGAGLDGANTLALIVAITVVIVTNIVTFTYAMHLVQREPIRHVLRSFAPLVPVWGITWILNVAFGIIFAATYTWSTAGVFLFSVPLALLHWASKAYAAAVVDQERLAGLHRATLELATPVDPREAIPRFLGEVRQSFGGDAVDLVLFYSGRIRTVHRVDQDGYGEHDEPWELQTLAAALSERGRMVRVNAGGSDPIAAALLELEGWRDCLAAPLLDGERTLGVLCVYNRQGLEGFERGEEAVLQALAVEAARGMTKASLLDAILEERQKLADIVGRTSDGILTISPGGTVKTWNLALERITGHGAAEMIGSRLFGTLVPRDTDGVAVWLERWAEDDAALPSDIEITTRAGESRWLSCSYTRVADPDGRASMLIVVARDATEARELERLKDDFVATVSHELRTPLTPIKGWAVTLLQLGEHLSPEQREEGVQAILRHSERLERLITNILEVSKVERGLSDRRDAIVDVLAVAEKTVADFRTENGQREIVFRVDGARHTTRGDEVWVEQILSNLLSNATKYSPADMPIEVAVTGSHDAIELSVTDRGPGIPEHEMERIFERFKRLGDHMTRSQGGTGLGLYIARQLARAIGGELSVRSTAGKGATFTLRLVAQAETVPVAS
jgi:PAS domain S-box-containing protein